MVATGMATEQERREEQRHAVDLPVVIRPYRAAPLRARMRDLSRTGTMVALADSALARGDEVVLVALGIERVATVAWIEAEFLGLTFHLRLHDSELAALRRIGKVRGHA